jgi:hypothetical protein
MHGTLRAEVAGATKIDRPYGRATDHLVAPSVLADISRKVLWPEATAPCLAAAIGKARGDPCPVRTAERYLAGDRDWSSDAVAVIIAEILKRHMGRE